MAVGITWNDMSAVNLWAASAQTKNAKVEIARGLAEYQISGVICFSSLHDGKIGENTFLEDVILTTPTFDLFAFGDHRTNAGLGVESRNATATRRIRSARVPLGLNSSSSSPDRLWRINSALPHVRGNHLFNLLGL